MFNLSAKSPRDQSCHLVTRKMTYVGRDALIRHLLQDDSARDIDQSILSPMDAGESYLFAKNEKDEGFFLVWHFTGRSTMTSNIYEKILAESQKHGLKPKMHVFACRATFYACDVVFHSISPHLAIIGPEGAAQEGPTSFAYMGI